MRFGFLEAYSFQKGIKILGDSIFGFFFFGNSVHIFPVSV